jgi:hypothetical protein
MTECAWCARPPPNGDTSRCCSEVSISDARLWAAATGALRRRAHIQPSTLSRIGPSPTEPPEKLRWPRNVTVGCSQTARSSPLRRVTRNCVGFALNRSRTCQLSGGPARPPSRTQLRRSCQPTPRRRRGIGQVRGPVKDNGRHVDAVPASGKLGAHRTGAQGLGCRPCTLIQTQPARGVPSRLVVAGPDRPERHHGRVE